MLEPPQRVVYDDGGDKGGMHVASGPWQPPDVITDEVIAEARLSMQRYDADAEPVDSFALVDWLIDLLDGKAHGLDPVALASRCRALAEGVEDYPRRCFTKETRKLLRRRFQFVPTDKELIDAIDEIDRADRLTAQRLMKILDIGPRRAKRRDDDEPAHQRAGWTTSPEASEERGRQIRAAQAKANRELAAQIAAEQNEPPVPSRLPGESDYAFMARLKHHRDEVLGAASKVMMRGGSRQTPAQRDAGRLKPNLPKQIAEAMAAQTEDGRNVLQRRAAAMAQAARVELDDGEL